MKRSPGRRPDRGPDRDPQGAGAVAYWLFCTELEGEPVTEVERRCLAQLARRLPDRKLTIEAFSLSVSARRNAFGLCRTGLGGASRSAGRGELDRFAVGLLKPALSGRIAPEVKQSREGGEAVTAAQPKLGGAWRERGGDTCRPLLLLA